MHVRRTYGNYAICRLIIQTGRFDETLLAAILESISSEDEDENDESKEKKKRAKVRAAVAHRRGRHVFDSVQKDWDLWWKLSSEDRHLYYRFEHGMLLEERNTAVHRYGHGMIFDENEQYKYAKGFQELLTQRALEADADIRLKALQRRDFELL